MKKTMNLSLVKKYIGAMNVQLDHIKNDLRKVERLLDVSDLPLNQLHLEKEASPYSERAKEILKEILLSEKYYIEGLSSEYNRENRQYLGFIDPAEGLDVLFLIPSKLIKEFNNISKKRKLNICFFPSKLGNCLEELGLKDGSENRKQSKSKQKRFNGIRYYVWTILYKELLDTDHIVQCSQDAIEDGLEDS